jgi:hypothetical protein
MTTSFIYTRDRWHVEAGYNFYARRGECLRLECPWPSTIALIDGRIGGGFINPIRDITGNPLTETPAFPIPATDYDRGVIVESDLDLDSAITPAVISNTTYASIGYNFEACDYPLFINGGGSYEFGNNNNASLDRWVLWIKGGVAF